MSGQIPRPFIQDLLSRCDIIDVIDARVPLKKASSQNYVACCPFHQEKSPSFTVSVRKQFYHCFGCGAHGDVVGFLMNFDRMDFVDAIEYLAAQQGLSVPYEQQTTAVKPKPQKHLYDYLSAATSFYQAQLQQNTAAQQYLQTRGLSQEIQQRYLLGYAPASGQALVHQTRVTEADFPHFRAAGLIGQTQTGRYYDVFRDRIMFPIRDRQGRIVGFGGRIFQNQTDKEGNPLAKYYNTGQTPIFNKSAELYGLYEALQCARELPYALLVEGYMDVLALAQYGFDFAMASMGTAATKQHLERLYRHTNKILFCFDGDQAGQKAAIKALATALPLLTDGRQLQLIFLPNNHDPDSFIRTQGTEAFKAQLAQAKPFDDFFWRMLLEHAELNHAGGRAAFYQEAMQYLKLLPQGKLATIMHEELSRLTRMEATPEAPPPSKRIVTQQPSLSCYERVLALILQNPSLLAAVVPQIPTYDAKAQPFLTELALHIEQLPNPNTANLLLALKDHPEYDNCVRLACYPLLTPEEGMQQELHDSLLQCQKQQQNNTIQALMQKIRQGTASPEERAELQKQLTQQKMAPA